MPEEPHPRQGNARFPATREALSTQEQRGAFDLILGRRGRVPAPYLPLLGSPRVADLFEQLSTELWTGSLPQNVLEAVFLMTARRENCDHQWRTHQTKALAAGLTMEMIDAIALNLIPATGGVVEAALRVCKALVDAHCVPEGILLDAQEHFGARGLAELIAFCGIARTVAMLLNVQSSARLSEPELPPLNRPAFSRHL